MKKRSTTCLILTIAFLLQVKAFGQFYYPDKHEYQTPKGMWTINDGGHTEAFTTYGATYQPRLVAFFKKCLEQKEKSNQGNPHSK
jgi:hypothetical protein